MSPNYIVSKWVRVAVGIKMSVYSSPNILRALPQIMLMWIYHVRLWEVNTQVLKCLHLVECFTIQLRVASLLPARWLIFASKWIIWWTVVKSYKLIASSTFRPVSTKFEWLVRWLQTDNSLDESQFFVQCMHHINPTIQTTCMYYKIITYYIYTHVYILLHSHLHMHFTKHHLPLFIFL